MPMFAFTLLTMPLILMVSIAFDNRYVEAVCYTLILVLGVLSIVDSFRR